MNMLMSQKGVGQNTSHKYEGMNHYIWPEMLYSSYQSFSGPLVSQIPRSHRQSHLYMYSELFSHLFNYQFDFGGGLGMRCLAAPRTSASEPPKISPATLGFYRHSLKPDASGSTTAGSLPLLLE